jgi:hypothetical protein
MGMSLPEFNDDVTFRQVGTLRPLQKSLLGLGVGTAQRVAVTNRLRRIYTLAVATGYLDRLVVFGSYVSDIAEPNDVDVILVMHNDFAAEDCPADSLVLFDHTRAHNEMGASIFWVREDMLLGEPLEQFLAHWEQKRDGGRRGIVEIRP